jgi:hypothetical protein
MDVRIENNHQLRKQSEQAKEVREQAKREHQESIARAARVAANS